MAKAAIYAEEAKRLFVREGFSLDTIVGMLDGKVARKTLYNWKNDGFWDDKRREFLEQTKDLKDQLKSLVTVTLSRAEAEPTPKNLLALLRAIQAYENFGGIRPQFEDTEKAEQKKAGENLYSREAIEAIKGMYGLKA